LDIIQELDFLKIIEPIDLSDRKKG